MDSCVQCGNPSDELNADGICLDCSAESDDTDEEEETGDME